MDTLRKGTGRTICLLLLSFGWAGCSGPGSAHRNEGARPIPFRDGDQTVAPAAVQAASSPSAADASSQNGDVPFRDSESWPAGTLITVKLSNPVLSADVDSDGKPGGGSHAGSFEALVDDPVVIEGVTVVPRGSSATGRIESSGSSQQEPAGPERLSSNLEKLSVDKPATPNDRRSYIRLTLDSVDVAGRTLTIRTSSLFARISSHQRANPGAGKVSLEQGRRLTFRLSEPVYVATQPIISSR
jgi:hypothetical protein